ncbi:hypothetical protein M9Y10_040047 [Tritrichomonas musculus]|uniref:Uncharacterized protein n=1 Tax=Tritrichomonas musculus TaxID=1915356 RepID=A0ABR2GS64_9EUKA
MYLILILQEESIINAQQDMPLEDPSDYFKYSISNNQVTILRYIGPGGKVIIPHIIENYLVVSIGDSAFSGNKQITNIIIPDSILYIKKFAFYNCNNLEEMKLPNQLKELENEFISKCNKIKNITIPKSLTTIYRSMDIYWPFTNSFIEKAIIEEGTTNIISHLFYNVKTLKEVILPMSITSIGSYAFGNCPQLNNINLHVNISNIESYAFYFTGLTSIKLPEKIKEISFGLFYNCRQLRTIILPQNITTIYKEAFYNCVSLTEIELPDQITFIGPSSFYNCNNLEEMKLPNQLKELGNEFISKCNKIKNITIPKSLTTIYRMDIYWPFTNSFIEKAIIEEGTTNIISHLFYNVKTLKEVILPMSITIIGSYAFAYCSSLSTINLCSEIASIQSNSFIKCNSLNMKVVAGSYAEEYAKTYSFNYTYLYNSLILNVSITNCSDLSGMKLILNDTKDNIKNCITTTSNKNFYSFFGLTFGKTYDLQLLNLYGDCIANRTSIILKENITTINIERLFAIDVYLKIYDDKSNDVTSNTRITWYDESGNYLSQGSKICQVLHGKLLKYSIDLKDKLMARYQIPKKQTYIVSYNNNISFTLVPYQSINITGKITNETGFPIQNVVIYVIQNFKNKGLLTTSDENGSFLLTIFDISSKIIISQNGFLNKEIEICDFSHNKDLGIIKLSEITGRTINLNITYVRNDQSNCLFNSDNLKLSLFDLTKKETISDFAFQNNVLILCNKNNLNPIQINISTQSNDFYPASVILNSNISQISIKLIQKGQIKINFVKSQNIKNVAMIYNSNNKLACSLDFYLNSASSSFLDDGNYSIVVLGKSVFFNTINNLTDFQSASLTNSIDFALSKVIVKRGNVAQITINEIPKFDESKFHYIDDTESYFLSTKTKAIAGSFFVFKGKFEFKSIYKRNVSNLKIIIDIPDNCNYVQGSLIINQKLASFSLIDNKMVIPTLNEIESFRFCLIPQIGGKYIISPFIEFEYENKTIIQPINSAEIEADDMNFYVPKETSKKAIDIYGNAAFNSQIIAYDNDLIVGQTKSDINGDWMINMELVNPSTYSNHKIFIKIVVSKDIEIKSDVHFLTYNFHYIDVSNIIILTKKNKMNYDYPYPKEKLYYTAFPGKNSITFLVNFTDNDPNRISNVVLLSQTISNKVVKIPTIYDKDKKLWIAQHTFSMKTVPNSLEVKYDLVENYTLPSSCFNYDLIVNNESIKEYENNIKKFGYNTTLIMNTFSDNSSSFGKLVHKIIVEDSTDEYYSVFKEIKINSDEIKKIENNINFSKIYDDKGKVYYISNANQMQDEFPSFTFIDPQKHKKTEFKLELPELKELHDICKNQQIKPNKKLLAKKFYDIFDKLYEYSSFFAPHNGIDILFGLVSYVDSLIKASHTFDKLMKNQECMPFGSYALAATGLVNYVVLNSYMFGDTIKSSRKDIMKFATPDPKQWIVSKVTGVAADYSFHLTDSLIDKYGCDRKIPENGRLTAIIDPSGYVYEAVKTNRVEGVVATLFEKEIKEDLYGESYEKVVFWNANIYGQQNPLITDEFGWYQWDVPRGFWQVKYEKLNYETSFSNWLEVPPPQFDVNIPLVSFVQPEIKRIIGFESYIEIEFTKFMMIDNMNSSNILISKNDKIVNGKIIFVNSEPDPNLVNVNYSLLINFIPDEPFFKNDKISVLIKNDLTSYSGVRMNSDYMKTISIIIKPKIICDNETQCIIYGETNRINFTVLIDPFESVLGKKLLLKTDSKNIVEPENQSIEIKNNKSIDINLKILNPGKVQVFLEIENTSINSLKEFQIDVPKIKLEPVIASIRSNSYVLKNISLELYSKEEDSVIYFKTNETDEYQIYNEPLIIEQDIVITTFATHDDYKNSDLVSYTYFLSYTYTITFDSDGGCIDILSKEVRTNEKYGKLPLPNKDNFIFKGWFLNQQYSILITDESIVNISENTTVYAKWIHESKKDKDETIEQNYTFS